MFKAIYRGYSLNFMYSGQLGAYLVVEYSHPESTSFFPWRFGKTTISQALEVQVDHLKK